MTHHLLAWSERDETVAPNGVAKRSIPGLSHDHEQFVQVVSGSGVLETEQGRTPFSAGHVFHFPAGAWHAATFETETVLIETNLAG